MDRLDVSPSETDVAIGPRGAAKCHNNEKATARVSPRAAPIHRVVATDSAYPHPKLVHRHFGTAVVGDSHMDGVPLRIDYLEWSVVVL